MYFPLRTAFAVSQRFWKVASSFSLVSMNLFNSSLISWLTHSSFSRMVFNLHMFEFLPNFFLWLSSSFKALWSENMQETIPIFWYQLRPDLWPSMWSILEKVPCALEKNVYSVAFGCKILYISVKSIWSSVSFKALVSGIPGWLNSLAPALGPGRDPGVPGSSPTSNSLHGACFSLCLCLCLSLSVSHE